MTITTEQLEARAVALGLDFFIEDRSGISVKQWFGGAQGCTTATDAEVAMWELLAAREAAPVAFLSKGDVDTNQPHILAKKYRSLACTLPVYTAPPAPAVPDCFLELLKHAGGMAMGTDWNSGTAAKYHRTKLCEAVDACRAAMLGNCATNKARAGAGLTAETGENCADAIPPGYRLVPVEPTADMIAAAMECDDVLFNDDETFCVQFGNIYAAMLAAAPEVGQ